MAHKPTSGQRRRSPRENVKRNFRLARDSEGSRNLFCVLAAALKADATRVSQREVRRRNQLLFLAEREYCWAPVESTLGFQSRTAAASLALVYEQGMDCGSKLHPISHRRYVSDHPR
jgi:hypothetical protein